MDSYQAIYDGVRSRISNGDIGQAVEQALSGVQEHFACAASTMAEQFYEYSRPSTIYKPALSVDGNQWCALLGENLQVGVAGFGDSPALAYEDFDNEWRKPLKKEHP